MFKIIFLLLLSAVTSQTIIIRDANINLPLVDVNVFTDDNGTTTDNNGICYLDSFGSKDIITFSLIGYQTLTLTKSQIPNILFLENHLISMDLINVVAENKTSRKFYVKLERDVRKVYPYAKTVADLLVKYDSIIDSLDFYSGYKRYYRKKKIFLTIENELISNYGFSIRRLTKNQGRILIKLVDRETSRTSFKIIKDFRNIFSAGFWQITARIFGHNLRSTYNPNKGEDRLIEFIINRIDSKENYFTLSKK